MVPPRRQRNPGNDAGTPAPAGNDTGTTPDHLERQIRHVVTPRERHGNDRQTSGTTKLICGTPAGTTRERLLTHWNDTTHMWPPLGTTRERHGDTGTPGTPGESLGLQNGRDDVFGNVNRVVYVNST